MNLSSSHPAPEAAAPVPLPLGTELRELPRNAQGDWTLLYRRRWDSGRSPVQWNSVHSHPGVMRGVHVHIRHCDYLTVVKGSALVGLRDLRPASPTFGRSALVELDALRPQALTIPCGVAHGFYFPQPSLHVYAVSCYFDPRDELGCRWDDPALQIDWPVSRALVSDRDREAGTLSGLNRQLERRGAFHSPGWQPTSPEAKSRNRGIRKEVV